MIVYLAGAIQAFVMYCVNGTSCSSLLIESTDSMIESTDSMIESTDSMIESTDSMIMAVFIYVTVHAERDHKSAILILRYGGVRQKWRILCFSIFFAQGMRKAL